MIATARPLRVAPAPLARPLRIGVITTSFPRFAGDPAGSFVGAHVAALRALGHDVDVFAAGDDRAPGHDVDVFAAGDDRAPRAGAARSAGGDHGTAIDDGSRTAGDGQTGSLRVTRVGSRGLFYDGGAPDALERAPLRSALAAAAFTIRLAAHLATRSARALVNRVGPTISRPSDRARPITGARPSELAAPVADRLAMGSPRWDLAIAHWLVPSALAALPSRTPLLAIAHGGDVHTLRRLGLLGPVLHLLRARGARLAFVSSELLAIARAAAPSLAAWLDRAAIVQPMGVDLDHFAALARAPEPRTVAILARLVPIKGVDVAIAALAHLRTPVRLVIAGDGPERTALEVLFEDTTKTPWERNDANKASTQASEIAHPRDHGICPIAGICPVAGICPIHDICGVVGICPVELVGQLDAAGRDELLRRAALVVVPSRVLPNGRSEGMPLAALEALAAGVPVVASAVGGLRDLSQVTLVRPGDPRALAAAIDRTLARVPDPAGPRAAVADLDWPRVAERLLAHAVRPATRPAR